MNYNITAYSTALFSTWINVEELNLLIDAGDGLSAGLLQKSRKIKHVFITHPDRDHLNGLTQFTQLNARESFPKIYYPKDAGSFPAMENFLLKFDPHVSSTKWIGIEDQTCVAINKQLEIQAIRNEHIQAPIGKYKSLSYKLFEIKKKLKPEFQSLDGNAIKEIVDSKGRDFITDTLKTNLISFSGDTPVDNYDKWDQSKILIHECTFLNDDEDNQIELKGNKHSRIDEVFKMINEIEIEQLILNHFSSRYSNEVITNSILKMCKKYNIKVPVFAVLPGEIKRDILNSNPVNA